LFRFPVVSGTCANFHLNYLDAAHKRHIGVFPVVAPAECDSPRKKLHMDYSPVYISQPAHKHETYVSFLQVAATGDIQALAGDTGWRASPR
ncbi:MAG: hypothetical protein ACRD36_05315, partial [Candidatus Acidiferrum sp.]